MKEKLAINFIGTVYLRIIRGGRILPAGKFKNAIQPSAKEIAAKNLILHPSAVIDTIALYDGVNLLSSKPISYKAIVSATEVKFESIFDPTDFSGSFTEGRLIASGIGNFSIVSNLVGSKSEAEALVVTWNISIP